MNKFYIESLKVREGGFYWEEGENYVICLESEDYELLENLVKDGDYEDIEEAIRGIISFLKTHYQTHNNLDFPSN